MPLTALFRSPTGFCCNRYCRKPLVGQFKIIKHGEQGYEYTLCMTCFHVMNHKCRGNWLTYFKRIT